MSLWNTFAGNARASGLSAHALAVCGREGPKLRLQPCLLALLGAVLVVLEASAGFRTAPTYPAGSRPWAVAVADFNGDGIADLAVADYGDNSRGAGVSILLGNGDGTFRAPQSQVFGLDTYSIAVGDFNGDGYPDLAVTGRDSSGRYTVSVLLGNGDGTLQAPQSYPAPERPNSVAVGDFNGDGIADLAVAGYELFVFLGNGDGTFLAPVSYAPSGLSVVVADFNGDGILDLAVAWGDGPYDSTVNIFLGNGDGTFQAAQSNGVRQDPYFLAAGDFNGDGIPDLALASRGNGTGRNAGLSILLGNGDGTFREAHYYPTAGEPVSVAVRDFNGDGHLDLALANARTVSIFLGNGDGSFGAAVLYAAAGFPVSVAVGDFNGDGVADLAVATASSNTVTILLGNGDGTFQAARSYWDGGSLLGYTSIAAGDFNQDGIPDLVVVNSDGGPTTILLGKGDGSFSLGQSYTPGGSIAVRVADFNGDGIADLAMLGGVLLGNGDGTFQPLRPFEAGKGPNSLAVADFNGDGILDIVTSNFAVVGTPRNPQIIENGVRVLLGKGDGTFGPAQAYAIQPGASGPVVVVVGDFNGDGSLDLAVGNGNSGALSILLGKGDGTFAAARNYTVGRGLYSLAVGDVNGDGHLDLVALNAKDVFGVTILLGKGDGTFQQGPHYPISSPIYPTSMAVGDFNQDGILDVVVTDGSGVSLLLGNGDGTFQAAQSYAAGSGGLLVVADFNGDGWPDLALSTSATILLNQP